MSEGIITAAIAGAVAFGGVIGKLVSDYWSNKTRISERQQAVIEQNEDRAIDILKGQLSHCQQETNFWRDFSFSKVKDMEEIAEKLKQLKTGGPS